MLFFLGIHGTSKKNAKSILKNGFRLSSYGFRGKGLYLWPFYSDDTEAKLLGINWVETANTWGHFGEKTPDKALISAKLIVEPEKFLDLNEQRNNEYLNTYIFRASKSMETEGVPEVERIKLMSNVYDKAVKHIEEKFNEKYAIILCRVAVPHENFYDNIGEMELFQQPLCLVVRSLEETKIEIKDIISV